MHEEAPTIILGEPNVVRAAPTALYNTFADVRGFVGTLARVIGA